MIAKAKNTPLERVRVLQRTLYRAAKANPTRKFGVLYDKVCREDTALSLDKSRRQSPWEHPLQDTIFEKIVVHQCCGGVKASQNDDDPGNCIVITAENVIQSTIF